MNKEIAELTVNKSADYHNKLVKVLEDAGFVMVLRTETITDRYYIVAKMDELDFKQPKKMVGKLISIEVLDKIRAEVVENSIEDYEYHGCGTNELIIETSEVLRILDKYKAESEGKE